MRREAWFKVVFIIMMALVIIVPAFAQDGTEEAAAEASAVFVMDNDANEAPLESVADDAQEDVTLNNPEYSWMMGWLVIVVGIAIPFSLLLAAYVTVTNIQALRDSVTPEAMREVLQPLYVTVSKRLDQFQESARSTPDPVDDVVASILAVPFDLLEKHMADSGYIITKKSVAMPGDDDLGLGLEPLPQG